MKAYPWFIILITVLINSVYAFSQTRTNESKAFLGVEYGNNHIFDRVNDNINSTGLSFGADLFFTRHFSLTPTFGLLKYSLNSDFAIVAPGNLGLKYFMIEGDNTPFVSSNVGISVFISGDDLGFSGFATYSAGYHFKNFDLELFYKRETLQGFNSGETVIPFTGLRLNLIISD